MPGTTSGSKAVIAFGRQTAGEGTALVTPKYEIPMGDGGWAGPERGQEDLPWTDSSQDPLGTYINHIAGMVDVSVPVLPISCVSLLQAVLGARTTTGIGPFTHALTFADALPWFTWFYEQPGANFWKVADGKIDEAELAWEPGQPLSLGIRGRGKAVPNAAGAKWGAATLVEAVEPFFTYIGATMKLDQDATPAVTTVRNIQGGSISIARNLQVIQTDRVTDQFIGEGNREITVSLDEVVFESNDFINKVLTGATAGGDVTSVVAYGSLEYLFLGSDQAVAATRSLKIALPKMQFAIDQIPQADPGGDAVTYTVTGKAYKPAAGAILTATVINGDAGTNY